ncbi:hypothetical protein A0H81_01001 [Grifola frondosa]|uniref:Uncharacterized protein n=1 Tax=Grifola frondosa TaxID=5627 RepID=A0A1C7MP25_GRIFR|nr:hypothetical protein A0H81_01001 [Grifola frondosa]
MSSSNNATSSSAGAGGHNRAPFSAAAQGTGSLGNNQILNPGVPGQSMLAHLLAQQMNLPPQLLNQQIPFGGFPNPLINQMPGANFMSFPQQMFPGIGMQTMHSQLAATAPIGSSPKDEDLMVSALRGSKRKGQTYKEALEALHGTHGCTLFCHFMHGFWTYVPQDSASIWKDWYLDHKERIDARVSNVRVESGSSNVSTTTLADASSTRVASSRCFTIPATPAASASNLPRRPEAPKRFHKSSASLNKKPDRQEVHRQMKSSHLKWKGKNREAQNDLAEYNGAAPSKYKYTDEDQAFCVETIKWELKKNRQTSKKAIAIKLSKKAPHHSYHSWKSYLRDRHDLVDGLMAEAHGHVRESSEGSDHTRVTRRHENDSSQEHGDDSSSDLETSSSDSTCTYDGPDTEEDEQNMGESGVMYNKADFRIMARYIARTPHWNDLPSQLAQWEPFHKKYPNRSYKAWAIQYTTNERGAP